MNGHWDRLAERRMRKAESEGELSRLEGEGKPLKIRPDAPLVDPGEALGYRIMHEHGALPEEIELRKALEMAKAAYADASDDADRKAAMARIAEVQMKLSMATEAHQRFLR